MKPSILQNHTFFTTSTLGGAERYWYAFNGMEQVNNIYGNGAAYIAPFWMYDSRLGRRWNQDPKPNPIISPYTCFANNPIFYSDPLGDTLEIVSESSEALIKTINMINEGLGGFYTAEIIDGKLTLTATDKEGDITEEQAAFKSVLSDAINSKETTKLEITQHSESKSEEVLFGDFETGIIDIDDIMKIDNSGGLVTQQGVFAHEVEEQFAKQVLGVTESRDAHYNYAEVAENLVNPSIRGMDGPSKQFTNGQGVAIFHYISDFGLGTLKVELFNGNVTRTVQKK